MINKEILFKYIWLFMIILLILLLILFILSLYVIISDKRNLKYEAIFLNYKKIIKGYTTYNDILKLFNGLKLKRGENILTVEYHYYLNWYGGMKIGYRGLVYFDSNDVVRDYRVYKFLE